MVLGGEFRAPAASVFVPTALPSELPKRMCDYDIKHDPPQRLSYKTLGLRIDLVYLPRDVKERSPPRS